MRTFTPSDYFILHNVTVLMPIIEKGVFPALNHSTLLVTGSQYMYIVILPLISTDLCQFEQADMPGFYFLYQMDS